MLFRQLFNGQSYEEPGNESLIIRARLGRDRLSQNAFYKLLSLAQVAEQDLTATEKVTTVCRGRRSGRPAGRTRRQTAPAPLSQWEEAGSWPRYLVA